MGDLDGDGVDDLAVGAYGDDTRGDARGEVYVQFMNADGTVKSFIKIASDTNGGPTLNDEDHFGWAVASLGDLDGDGIVDLAVGAYADDTGGNVRGAVHVLFLNADGSVKSSTKIASDTNGGPTLTNGDRFGSSVTSPGDLDGDGVVDIAVGAYRDSTEGSYQGAVHVLFLNSDGTVKDSTKITSDVDSGPSLINDDFFGFSVASLGDLDGDGLSDLAVGARGDDTGGSSRGAVHVLFLNSDGSVKSSTKIANNTNGGPTIANFNQFGFSITSLGDLDGDGIADLAVGADRDHGQGYLRGAVHVLFLNSDGSVKNSTKIASGTNGGPTLTDSDYFGSSIASVGDLDGDGIVDVAVGARGDDTGGSNRGSVHLLLLNQDGTAKSSTEIAQNRNGGPDLNVDGRFGWSVTSLGDLNGDGVVDLAVGADRDNTGGTDGGAVHVLFLEAPAVSTVLPAGGNYEVLRDGGDLILRMAGGAELIRQSASSVAKLAITGSSGDDAVTVLDSGGAVTTPILFNGKGGADQFDASLATGPATLLGGAGNDTLTGGTNDDLIIAGSGSDTISSGDGNDLINAGPGNDTVAGGDGDDRILGRAGKDSLIGGAGDDTVIGGGGHDTIEGGLNADVLVGGRGHDTISGGDGTDRILGGGGQDRLDGNDGDDTLVGGFGADDLAGGLGNDTLNGTFRDDTFNQVEGQNTLIGGQRPAARPAPVQLPLKPENAPEVPVFVNAPTERNVSSKDAAEQIDEIFIEPLLPELLEL